MYSSLHHLLHLSVNKTHLLIAYGSDDDHALVERYERLAHRHWKSAEECSDRLHERVIAVHIVELVNELRRETHTILAVDDLEAAGACSDLTAVIGQTLIDELHADWTKEALDVHDGGHMVVL